MPDRCVFSNAQKCTVTHSMNTIKMYFYFTGTMLSSGPRVLILALLILGNNFPVVLTNFPKFPITKTCNQHVAAKYIASFPYIYYHSVTLDLSKIVDSLESIQKKWKNSHRAHRKKDKGFKRCNF